MKLIKKINVNCLLGGVAEELCPFVEKPFELVLAAPGKRFKFLETSGLRMVCTSLFFSWLRSQKKVLRGGICG